MTATLDGVTKKKEPAELSAEQQAATELVRLAKERGVSLTGPEGLLKQLTKTVIETALSEEMTEHLGYEKHDPAGRESGNIRNGTRAKTVLTEASGQVQIEVPRDRAGTFEPQIVRKRQRRLNGVDEIVLSLYAKGLTTGEISSHFAEIYGASVSRETISRITDKVIEEMQSWQTRPLDEIYAAIFIDAIVVKIRDGQVANRPIYAAIGVTLEGEKDILGLWAGTGGEGAKFWMAVLTDLRNRGVRDVFFVVCDGLKGLPEVVGNVWSQAIVQTCIIHLIRNTFRLASRKYWDELRHDVKPIYTAVNAAAARAAFDELAEKWGARYPAIIRLWDNAWQEFIPFLDYGACCRIAWRHGGQVIGWDDRSWPSRIARSFATSPCYFPSICVNGCRRITWCGSCWTPSTRWTRQRLNGQLGDVAGLARRGMTRGCCWGCWSTRTARGCGPRGRSSAGASPTSRFACCAPKTARTTRRSRDSVPMPRAASRTCSPRFCSSLPVPGWADSGQSRSTARRSPRTRRWTPTEARTGSTNMLP
jgi:putative transposase